MLKIRQFRDRLIFNMGIPIPEKMVFILKQGLGYQQPQYWRRPTYSFGWAYFNYLSNIPYFWFHYIAIIRNSVGRKQILSLTRHIFPEKVIKEFGTYLSIFLWLSLLWCGCGNYNADHNIHTYITFDTFLHHIFYSSVTDSLNRSTTYICIYIHISLLLLLLYSLSLLSPLLLLLVLVLLLLLLLLSL